MFSGAEVPGGTQNGTNAVFTLAASPSPAISLALFRNGTLQKAGTDFNLSGATITFVSGAIPQAADILQAFYNVTSVGSISLSGTPTAGQVPTATSGTAAVWQTPVTPLLNVPTPGTSATLSGNSETFVCTGACTITVPLPVAGTKFCVLNDDNIAGAITLSALGGSGQYESTARTAYGTAGTGTFVSAGAVGDMVCILGRDGTHYLTTEYHGTWTAN